MFSIKFTLLLPFIVHRYRYGFFFFSHSVFVPGYCVGALWWGRKNMPQLFYVRQKQLLSYRTHKCPMGKQNEWMVLWAMNKVWMSENVLDAFYCERKRAKWFFLTPKWSPKIQKKKNNVMNTKHIGHISSARIPYECCVSVCVCVWSEWKAEWKYRRRHQHLCTPFLYCSQFKISFQIIRRPIAPFPFHNRYSGLRSAVASFSENKLHKMWWIMT